MTDGGSTDDPFHWTPERLIQELCTPDRSWDAPPPRKWPDPERLAVVLKEHDLDGQDLITYEDVMGRDAFDSLYKDLEIKKIPHKASLRSAIQTFQSRSPAYRRWRESRTQTQESLPRGESPSAGGGGSAAQETDSIAPPQEPVKVAADAVNGHSEPLPLIPNGVSKSNGPEEGTLAKPAKKQKRVAPTNISSVSFPRSGTTPFLSVPEVDDPEVDDLDAEAAEEPWPASLPGAYLGHWKLPQDSVLPVPEPFEQATDVARPQNFSWAVPQPIPAGRRLQVHKTMRRYFRPRQSGLRLGRSRPSRSETADGMDDDDVVLPALGDSSDDEYDSETWEEMQKEEQERKNLQPRKDPPLPSETVDRVVADTMQKYADRWDSKKLPRLKQQEHALWTAARQSGSLKSKTLEALQAAEHLGRRIATLVEEIRAVEWKKEDEVRRQASVLDASIEDRQRALWMAKLYGSPKQPNAPTQSTRKPSAFARQRTLHARAAADGGEILTSSSSEDEGGDLGDFVVRDDASDAEPASTRAEPAESMAVDSPGWDALVQADHAGDWADNSDNNNNNNNNLIDLTTPSKPKYSVLTGAEAFPLTDLEAIRNQGAAHWQREGDVTRLLCALLYDYDASRLRQLFAHLGSDDETIWQTFCVRVMNRQEWAKKETGETPESILDDVACTFTRFFAVFLTCRSVAAHDLLPLSDEMRRQLHANRGRVGEFCVKLRVLMPYFHQPSADEGTPSGAPSGTLSQPEVVASEGEEEEEEEEEEDDDDDEEEVRTPVRRRKIRRDLAAERMRATDQARAKMQQDRSQAFVRSLAVSGQLSQNQSRLIINQAKEAQDGLIYVSPEIGPLIRDHQIEGVRFMWNQLVVPEAARQGCLLAHTMGLGKTMQVITLLVAIAEAAASPDATISGQIPADLRVSQTLILCPAGLVENWLDELTRWTPAGLVGDFYSVSADMELYERLEMVQTWAKEGGVLVIGYGMFRRLLGDFGETIRGSLEAVPRLVVADEAHALKNDKSKVHAATAHFATKARVAMTGSPLANSVEEYHAMINWVAPNYLADHREFTARYARPIRDGFYKDSTPAQRRQALKMLKVLKDTVAPKIHRATVAALKGELPPKREFILHLRLTDLQARIYDRFLDDVHNPAVLGDIRNTVQLWNLLINLTLLLAHPRVLQIRLLEMQRVAASAASAAPAAPVSGRAGTLPPAIVSHLLAAVAQRDLDQLGHSAKITVLVAILDEAKRVGDKVLVFSQSQLVLDYLEVLFQRQQRRFSRLDGNTAVGRRQALIKGFNTGRDEVYLISTTAGGVGLNIYGANRVVIFDFKWNPMHEQQAIGRAYRIGQTKPVFVYWLIVDGTCETVLHKQAVFKTQLASRVVDRKNPAAWAEQMSNYTAPAHIRPPLDDAQAAAFRRQDVVLDALLASPQVRSGLAGIVSTDTFEEEEPEAKLSAAELQEAANLISENKKRSRNPHDASPGPVEVPPPALVAPAPVGPVGQVAPVDPPFSTDASTASAPPRQPESAPSPPNNLIAEPADLVKTLQEQLTSGAIRSRPRVTDQSARGLAHKVVSDIRDSFRVSGVPARARWARLRNLAARDPVFADAILGGRIAPQILATMSAAEEERLVRELHSRRDTLMEDVQTTGRQRDPDLVRVHLHKSQKRKHPTRVDSAHRGRDHLAIREVLDRRKKKQPLGQPAGAAARLPPPARQAKSPEPGDFRWLPPAQAGDDESNPFVLD